MGINTHDDNALLLREFSRIEWTPQQKRAYHRILSGLRKHKGERLRFITLTSTESMDRRLNDYFRALKERIKRLTPARLLKMGYISPNDLKKYYPNKPLHEPIRFDYFKVETSEGPKGVLHILYFGDYIPQKWLSDAWREITGSAYIVDIRVCKDSVHSPRRLARYIIAQYVAGQSALVRFSWGSGWVGKGFVKVWQFIKKSLGDIKRCVKIWDDLLNGKKVVLHTPYGLYEILPSLEIRPLWTNETF